MNTQEKQAYDKFLADAAKATPEQRKVVAQKMQRAIESGQRSKLGNEWVSTEIMQQVVDAIKGM